MPRPMHGRCAFTVLTKQWNVVATVATAADSVRLPAAVAGLEVIVVNAAIVWYLAMRVRREHRADAARAAAPIVK